MSSDNKKNAKENSSPEEVFKSLVEEQGIKKKKRVKKKKEPPKKKDPVEVADHLSLFTAIKHICWSGETDDFREGVLAESHAIFVVLFCLVFPAFQVTAMAAAFVAVRRIFAQGIETKTMMVVAVQLLRSVFIAMTTKEDPKQKNPPTLLAFEILTIDQIPYCQFILDATFALSFGYIWLSLGKNWDAYHGTKMAALTMLYAMVHNPNFGLMHLFKLRGWL